MVGVGPFARTSSAPATPMPAPLVLEILDASGGSRQVRLEPDVRPLVIGSDASCELLLASPLVERKHAELFCDGEHWCLRDCNSSQGTYLDGNRLFVTAIRLEVGQRVRLGVGADAVQFVVIAGASSTQQGVDLRREVAGYVKQQKRERRKLRRWAIALPSAGMVAILSVWGLGALIVSHDQAERAAHPERFANEPNNEAVERLASIMAGEARPQDVDVKEIVAAASLGRSSKLVDKALDLVKPGSVMSAPPSLPIATSASPPTYRTPSAAAVDEGTLAALLDQQAMAEASKRGAFDAQIASQSETITLRRLRNLLDERGRLVQATSARALSKAESGRLSEIERRLRLLGIDADRISWQPGDELELLAKKIDPVVLERIRRQLVEAMSPR